MNEKKEMFFKEIRRRLRGCQRNCLRRIYKISERMTNFFSAPTTTTGIISLRKGQTGVIPCYTYGVPKPMVTSWWKDGKLLHVSAFLKTEHNSLIIQNTTSEDAGSYGCKTVQVYEFGKREQNITFYVEINGK